MKALYVFLLAWVFSLSATEAEPVRILSADTCNPEMLDRRFTAMRSPDDSIMRWEVIPLPGVATECYAGYLQLHDPNLARYDLSAIASLLDELYALALPDPGVQPDARPLVIDVAYLESALSEDLVVTGSGEDGEPFDETRAAVVALEFPDHLEKGETALFRLGISTTMTDEELLQAMGFDSDAIADEIRVTRRVQVDLAVDDPAALHLVPHQQAEPLLLTDDDVSEWTWSVRAIEPGSHQLIATVHYFTNVDGYDTPKKEQAYFKEIDVHVTAGQQVEDFLREQWKWIITALLLPLGGALFSYWRKKKKEEAANT